MYEVLSLAQLLNQPIANPVVSRVIEGRSVRYRKEAGAAYCVIKEEGFEIVFDEVGGLLEETIKPQLIVSCIHLWSEPDYHYKHPLPNGLKFGETLKSVLATQGAPIKRGGGTYDSFYGGKLPQWLHYSFMEFCVLHLEFDSQNQLSMISIMPRQDAP